MKTADGTAETPKPAKQRNDRTALMAELEGALETEAAEPAEDAGEETEGEEPEGVEADAAGSAREERARRTTDDEAVTERAAATEDDDTEEDEEEAEPEGVAMPETEAETDDEDAEEETETPEKTEAEAEAEQLERLAEAKGWPRSARKRLTKLLARVHAAEAKAADAAPGESTGEDASAEEGQGASAAPEPEEMRTVVKVQAELEAAITRREEQLAQLDLALATTLNPQHEQYDAEGWKLTDESGKVIGTYKLAQVLAARRKFEREVGRLDGQLEQAKAQHARAAAAYSEQARRQHAFMRDRRSPEYQSIQRIGKAYPEVTRIPDWESVLADAFAYRKQQAAKNPPPHVGGYGVGGYKAAGGEGARPAKPKTTHRVPVRPGAVPARVNGKRVESQKRSSRFAETGSHEDGKALVESLLE